MSGLSNEYNTDNTLKIFLSYAWKDSEIADKIDKVFTEVGVKIARDVRDINYRESIKEFMKRVSTTDYVILLISRSYLESSNCMYEVLELLKDPNYKSRILPIILKDANIFNPIGKIALIKYWETKIKDLNNDLKDLTTITTISSILNDLSHFENIRTSIDDFINVISDLNCKSIEYLFDNNFSPILSLIGLGKDIFRTDVMRVLLIKDSQEKDIEFRKLLKKYPNNINLTLVEGNIALEQGKNKVALSCYLDIIEQGKGSAFVYNNIGIAYRDLKEFNKAIEYLEMAKTTDPEFTGSYCNLGLIYSENILDFDLASQNFEKALEIDKDEGIAHFNYALLLNNEKNRFPLVQDPSKIHHHYLEALRIYPLSENVEKLGSVHYCYANFLFSLDDFTNARIHYEEALKYSPGHFQAHCNLAVLLRKNYQDYNLAKDHYERVLEINPLDVVTHNNLANLLWENLQLYELAEYHYIKAQKIDPNYKPDNYQRFKLHKATYNIIMS